MRPSLIIAAASSADFTPRGACPQCVACSAECYNNLGCALALSGHRNRTAQAACLLDWVETSSQRATRPRCSPESARSGIHDISWVAAN
jgi:hypothetical protein